MDKITTVIAKEWAEVFKNKLVLFSVLFLPLILAAIPLVMLFVFRQASGSMSAELNDPEIMELAGALCTGLSAADCTIVYTLNLFVLMFMILPVAIPVTIAAYSIVGEKTTRSLEPLPLLWIRLNIREGRNANFTWARARSRETTTS